MTEPKTSDRATTEEDTIPGVLGMYMVFTKQAIMDREGRIPSREELWDLVTDPANRLPIPVGLLEMDALDRAEGVFDKRWKPEASG